MTFDPDDVATATLERLLSDRWSCRSFRSDEVPRAEIDRVLDVARRSPSWCNTQPWHLHITSAQRTADLKEALAAAIADGPDQRPDLPFPESYDGVYRDRRRESGRQLYESLGIAMGDRAASMRQTLRNFDFFGAPHVAILTTDRSLGTYGAVDCGLFINNFLLAAHSRGIASIPQAALATQAPILRDFLDLPDDRIVVVGISFGYADLDHAVNAYRTDRQSTADVATFV
ncbi:nitroreductase [Gordonia hydrophobica]|uniref:Nitroreductase n=1 Tax=Gordonia hydrophobica TaxID=40516 RepID=A0ABZ2U3A0_9ACTN|nr:nitroreductase [Gordonia hydrophobica]MBM7367376.1 nitroreductase [Gordonia hydrophobica]